MEKQDKPAATTESFASSSSSTVDKTEHTQEAERNSDSSQAAGTTSYKTRVAEHVVERAIYSVPGTTDVDGGLLSRNYPRFDIRLDQERQVASVDVVIAVVWPSPAVRVATEVRTAIAEALDIYMGYEATRVNVTIGEAVPSKQRIGRDDVAARQRFSPGISPSAKSRLSNQLSIPRQKLCGRFQWKIPRHSAKSPLRVASMSSPRSRPANWRFDTR